MKTLSLLPQCPVPDRIGFSAFLKGVSPREAAIAGEYAWTLTLGRVDGPPRSDDSRLASAPRCLRSHCGPAGVDVDDGSGGEGGDFDPAQGWCRMMPPGAGVWQEGAVVSLSQPQGGSAWS